MGGTFLLVFPQCSRWLGSPQELRGRRNRSKRAPVRSRRAQQNTLLVFRRTTAAGSGVASLPHSKTEGLRPNPDKGGDYGNDRNLMHRSDNFLYFATELSFLAFAF